MKITRSTLRRRFAATILPVGGTAIYLAALVFSVWSTIWLAYQTGSVFTWIGMVVVAGILIRLAIIAATFVLTAVYHWCDR